MEHSVTLEVPLATAEQAAALYNTLRPDPELKPAETAKRLEVRDNVLEATLEGITERTLRANVNGFLDLLGEALECLATFAPEYYNAEATPGAQAASRAA